MIHFIAYFHWNEILSRLLLVQRTFYRVLVSYIVMSRNMVSPKHVGNAESFGECGEFWGVFGKEHEHVSSSSFDEVLACKGASPMKPIASEKDLVVFLSGEVEKENSSQRNSSLQLDPLQLDPVNTQRNSTKISEKTAREELKEISNAKNGDSAGKRKSYKKRKICQEVPNEEKGNANDDTRTCSKVAEKETKALDLKNGEVEAMLRELIRKQNLRRGQNNLVAQFQIRMLTLIFNDSENEKLRCCIEDQNAKHAEEVKEAKSKVAEAVDKEKGLRKKLQFETINGIMLKVTPHQMEKHNALLAKLKSEVVQAHDEVHFQKKCGSDAMRIKPEFVDNDGKVFWKLKSYNDESNILLQDVKMQDETASSSEEKWFVYGPEKKEEVDKYIHSKVNKWIAFVVLDVVHGIGKLAFFVF
ncbi:hypothetical protein DEO72_LG5g1341 [Vigna unguiculata]|uniref:Uncharacterized protein n=1 Tax=Vigna unguiculata TaxID=3917 RepID=A0A4D6LW32_VIGUN|nr:hypothetical protein DEO72_LG5g1341 [Vigna unguiculata]